jgi:hypothetical protein
MVSKMGPASTYSVEQLTELEHVAGTVVERMYAYASVDMKLIFAKLTALATGIDDSIQDEAAHSAMAQFSYKLYLGEAQPNPMLMLYTQALTSTSMAEYLIIPDGPTLLEGISELPIDHLDFFAYNAANSYIIPELIDVGRFNAALAKTLVFFPLYAARVICGENGCSPWHVRFPQQQTIGATMFNAATAHSIAQRHPCHRS